MQRLVCLVLVLFLPTTTSFPAEWIHRAPDDFLKSWIEGPIQLSEQQELTLGLPQASPVQFLRHTQLLPDQESIPITRIFTGVEAWRDFYTIQPLKDDSGFMVSLFREGSWKEAGDLPGCVLNDSEWFEGSIYLLMRPLKAAATSTHLYRSQVTPSGIISPPVLAALAPPGVILEKFAVTQGGLFGVGRTVGDDTRFLLSLRGLDSGSPGWSYCGNVNYAKGEVWDLTSCGSHLVLCSPLFREIEYCMAPRLGEEVHWNRRRLDTGPWNQALTAVLDDLETKSIIPPRLIHQFNLSSPAEVRGVRVEVAGQVFPRLRWRTANTSTDVYGEWSTFTTLEHSPIGKTAQFVQYEIRPPDDSSPVSIHEVALVLGDALGASGFSSSKDGDSKLTAANMHQDPGSLQRMKKNQTTSSPGRLSKNDSVFSTIGEEDKAEPEISGGKQPEDNLFAGDELDPNHNQREEGAEQDSTGISGANTPPANNGTMDSEANELQTRETPERLQPMDENECTRTEPHDHQEAPQGEGQEKNPLVPCRSIDKGYGNLMDSGLDGNDDLSTETAEFSPFSSPPSSNQPEGPTDISRPCMVGNGNGQGENGGMRPSGESAAEGDQSVGTGITGASLNGNESGGNGPQGDSAAHEPDNTIGSSGTFSNVGKVNGSEINSCHDPIGQHEMASPANPGSSTPPEMDPMASGLPALAQKSGGQMSDADEEGSDRKAGEATPPNSTSNCSPTQDNRKSFPSERSSSAHGLSILSHQIEGSKSHSTHRPVNSMTDGKKEAFSSVSSLLENATANYLIPGFLGLMLALLAASAFQEMTGPKQSALSPIPQPLVSPENWEGQKRLETTHANQLAAESVYNHGSPIQNLCIPTLPLFPEREKHKVDWRVAEPLPCPMAPATAFYHQGAVYVVNPHGTIAYARLRVDGALCPWGVRVGRLPSGAVKGVTAFVEPFIVCISDGEIHMARIDGEDLGDWKRGGKLDRSHQVTAAVGMGNRLFLVGGGTKGNPFPTVRSIVIEPQGQLRESQSHPPLPLGLTGGTLLAEKNTLYWLGGNCHGKTSRKVFSAWIGPESQFEDWRMEPDLPWGQCHPTAKTWGDTMWVILNKPMGRESVVFRGGVTSGGRITSWVSTGKKLPDPVLGASMPFAGGRFLLVGGWMTSEGNMPRTEVLSWQPA